MYDCLLKTMLFVTECDVTAHVVCTPIGQCQSLHREHGIRRHRMASSMSLSVTLTLTFLQLLASAKHGRGVGAASVALLVVVRFPSRQQGMNSCHEFCLVAVVSVQFLYLQCSAPGARQLHISIALPALCVSCLFLQLWALRGGYLCAASPALT
jgi:hypothetical protein